MTTPEIIPGLQHIARRYDVLLCDIWGVIHNGQDWFREACDALIRFRADRGPVVLISNSPRPSDGVAHQLDRIGVPRDAWSATATSGDATRALLAQRAPGPAWRLGPPHDAGLYEGLGLQFADLEHSRFISCTGPFDDEHETPADYRERFQDAVERGLEMVCANPDLVVHRGERLIYCAGALAQLYEELGGRVAMAGKPHGAIYDLALSKAAAERGHPLERSRVLCIGDGLLTDVRGANAQGLDVLFVAAGVHGAEMAGGLESATLDRLLRGEGLSASWAVDRLMW